MPTKTKQDQLIEATAGAGKTTLLVSTYLDLFKTSPPLKAKAVLAITFTKLAAQEMKQRILAQNTRGIKNPESLWITTIHGFCFDLLSAYKPEKTLSILESEAQNILRFKAINTQLQDSLTNPTLLNYLNHYPLKQLIRILETCFKERTRCEHLFKHPTQNDAISPKNPDLAALAKEAQSSIEAIGELFLATLKRYETLKREAGVYDYDDLIQKAKHLIKTNAQVQADLRENIHYVLVDEFQDTHHDEWALISSIISDKNPFGQNKLFVVGDRWQAIYGFRGTHSHLFERLIQESPPGVHQLHCNNYRSHPKLIEWINALFSELGKDDALPFRKLIAQKKGRLKEPLHLACFENSGDQGLIYQLETVIADIKHLNKSEGIPFEEMAILIRKKKNARLIQEALNEAQIPSQLQLGLSLFKEPVVLGCCHLLASLYYPFDAMRIIASLLSDWIGFPITKIHHIIPAIKAQKHLKLADFRDAMRPYLEKNEVSNDDIESCLHYFELLAQLSAQKKQHSPLVLLKKALAKLANTTTLQEHHSIQLDAFYDQLNNWQHQSTKHSWLNIIEMIDFHIKNPDHSTQAVLNNAAKGLSILSIHAAKGLEFEAVYIMELEAGFNFDYANPLLIDDELGFGLSLSKGTLKNPLREAIQHKQKAALIAEEKRLFYVACTRAKERLMLLASPKPRKTQSYLSFLLDCGHTKADHFKLDSSPNAPSIPLITTAPQEQLSLNLSKQESPTSQTYIAPTLTDNKESFSSKPKASPLTPESRPEPITKIALRDLLRKTQKSTSPSLPKPSSLAFGSNLHHMLEALIQNPHKPLEHQLKHSLNQPLDPSLEALAYAFCESELFQEILSADTLLIEHPFQYLEGKHLVSGRMDLVILSKILKGTADIKIKGITAHIVEFKTHINIEMRQFYKAQLHFYEKALREHLQGLYPKQKLSTTLSLYHIQDTTLETIN